MKNILVKQKCILTFLLIFLINIPLVSGIKSKESEWDRLNREVAKILMIIRNKYPPTTQGRLDLWKDYKKENNAVCSADC